MILKVIVPKSVAKPLHFNGVNCPFSWRALTGDKLISSAIIDGLQLSPLVPLHAGDRLSGASDSGEIIRLFVCWVVLFIEEVVLIVFFGIGVEVKLKEKYKIKHNINICLCFKGC